ncbi:MAG: hypothetical protein NTW52_08955 [Planctomycetota bacterium]|nr:hypothetical protein [Planctomycetota bacterium]
MKRYDLSIVNDDDETILVCCDLTLIGVAWWAFRWFRLDSRPLRIAQQ